MFWVYAALAVSLVSFFVAAYFYNWVKKLPTANPKLDEVGALMQDFRCDDYRDIRNPKIRARVKYFKEETEGVAAMCKTMQVIVDREREDAEVAKGKRIALNLWKNGEHDLDKIAQTTELSLEQVREAITEPCSA